MAETETATIMVRLMNNIDIVFIGAAVGFAAAKMTGRKRRGGMGMM